MNIMTPAASTQRTIDMVWSLVLVTGIFTISAIMPDAAYAANPVQTMFKAVCDALTGPTGKLIATVAIVIVGIGALLGKISWGMAMIVAIGVGLVFGAGALVQVLSGNQAGTSGKGCA
jgi:type IV secretion system protein VirB2